MSAKDKEREELPESDTDDDDSDDDWEELDEESERFPRMSFLQHLEELRSRIYKIVLVLLLAVVVSWSFVDPVWTVLEGPARRMLADAQEKSLDTTKKAKDLSLKFERLPPLPEGLKDNEQFQEFRRLINRHLREQSKVLEGQIRDLLVAKDAKLMQTAVGEAFFLKVKIAFLTGIAISFPFLMFQIWAFVAPGLYRREKKIAVPFIFFTTFFFALGLVFGYYIAVPFAGSFLMSFGSGFVQLITINKYMDFLVTMMLGLGIVFEIPMVIFLLSKLGIATPRWLIRNFRYAVLLIVIVAAIVTPTGDPVNLAIFSLPMIALYWVGVVVSALWGPKVGRWDSDETEEELDEDEDEDEDDGDDDDGDDDDDDGGEESEEGFDPKDSPAGGTDENINPDDPYREFFDKDK